MRLSLINQQTISHNDDQSKFVEVIQKRQSNKINDEKGVKANSEHDFTNQRINKDNSSVMLEPYKKIQNIE